MLIIIQSWTLNAICAKPKKTKQNALVYKFRKCIMFYKKNQRQQI